MQAIVRLVSGQPGTAHVRLHTHKPHIKHATENDTAWLISRIEPNAVAVATTVACCWLSTVGRALLSCSSNSRCRRAIKLLTFTTRARVCVLVKLAPRRLAVVL